MNTSSREVLLFKEFAQAEELHISDVAQELSVSSATIRNWIKTGILDSQMRGCVSRKSLEEFKERLLNSAKLTSRANKSKKRLHNHDKLSQAILATLEDETFDETIINRYEASLSESYRNKEGIYYTSPEIVTDMLKQVTVDDKTTFLDPCCGCGNFLIAALDRGVCVDNLYGFDTDATAVEIAKRRVFERCGKEATHIVCADFLAVAQELSISYDLIYTNPPWGKKIAKKQKDAYGEIYESGKSNDSCSLFVFASMKLLAPGGSLGFLLPESVLNIASFESLRELFLSFTIEEIKDYGKPFKSIQTKVYSIILNNSTPPEGHQVNCFSKGYQLRSQASFLSNPKKILNVWTTQREQEVIRLLLDTPHFTLTGNATWGMGVVTGDNKSKCSEAPADGLVPIFKGKDISPEGLGTPSYFIRADLEGCQQVAPLSMYYAEEKIIYRFISKRLVFFLDTEQRLILNSANMLLLSENAPVSGRQLTSLLNSNLMNWFFNKLFNTHKVLRSDLELLPLYTKWFVGDEFDEKAFLDHNSILYIDGTYRVRSTDPQDVQG